MEEREPTSSFGWCGCHVAPLRTWASALHYYLNRSKVRMVSSRAYFKYWSCGSSTDSSAISAALLVLKKLNERTTSSRTRGCGGQQIQLLTGLDFDAVKMIEPKQEAAK